MPCQLSPPLALRGDRGHCQYRPFRNGIASRCKPPLISLIFLYQPKGRNSLSMALVVFLSNTMSRYTGQRLDPISEEITPVDHQILCLGGTSSNLERLQSRLQCVKRQSPDFKTQLEETAYKMGYLRAELQWHKETK